PPVADSSLVTDSGRLPAASAVAAGARRLRAAPRRRPSPFRGPAVGHYGVLNVAHPRRRTDARRLRHSRVRLVDPRGTDTEGDGAGPARLLVARARRPARHRDAGGV